MARAIVRFSMNGDTTSAVRNAAVERLRNAGFANTATGTWEVQGAALVPVATAVQEALEILQNPAVHVPNAVPGAALDHIWVYIDQV